MAKRIELLRIELNGKTLAYFDEAGCYHHIHGTEDDIAKALKYVIGVYGWNATKVLERFEDTTEDECIGILLRAEENLMNTTFDILDEPLKLEKKEIFYG